MYLFVDTTGLSKRSDHVATSAKQKLVKVGTTIDRYTQME